MNAQLTRMTVPLKQIAQTTKAPLSAPVLMVLKETETRARVRTHIQRDSVPVIVACTLKSKVCNI